MTRIKYKMTGGTEAGFHHYSSLISCARRARLDKEAENQHGRPQYFDTGAAFHAHMELFRGPDSVNYDPLNTDFDPPISEEARAEAARLASAYINFYDKLDLGEIIAREVYFPTTKDQALQIAHAVGLPFKHIECQNGNHTHDHSNCPTCKGRGWIPPFSGRIDLIVNPSLADCERLFAARAVDLSPGYYLVDYKTDYRRDSILADKYENELQFVAYQLAAQVIFPEIQIRGCIIDNIIKTKVPGFQTFLQPFPGDPERAALHNFFRSALLMQKHLPDWANPLACFYPRTCRHFLSGKCDRT